MKAYIDRTLFTNPLGEYLNWLKIKIYYQLKYWGKHLRVGYMSVVSNCSFGKYNVLSRNTMVVNSHLGDFTYVNTNSYVLWTTLGKYCSIGPDVKIAPGKHPATVYVSTHPITFNRQRNFVKHYTKGHNFKNYEPVIIGNDVWIGANAVIMDGVHIADGAIVAANAVVVKNVGPYEIVGGNPAKFIKKRFTDAQINYLLDFKWWDKDEDWIEENISRFWNVKEFIADCNFCIDHALYQEVL